MCGAFTTPASLLSTSTSDMAADLMSYTLRLVTGSRRGSGLSEPQSGVNVVLFGEDGRASLQYLPRFDTQCDSPFLPSRFDAGNVDDVVLLVPDLGTITAIWIAPEQGTWFLEEATLLGSTANMVFRFPCGRVLGDDEPAAELRPKMVMERTLEEKRAVQDLDMADYRAFKASMLKINTGLVVTGAVAATAALGIDYGKAFCGGGVVGLLYLYLLEKQVDSLAPTKGDNAAALLGPLVSGPARMLMIASLGIAAAKGSGVSALATSSLTPGDTDPRQLLAAGVLGFFLYKISVVVAAATQQQSILMDDDANGDQQ